MFYSILTIVYILLIEVFVTRNVGLYFAKLNFEDKENVKKNAIMLSIYLFLYLATLVVRYIIKIITFEMDIFILLDILVLFGMYVLYADFIRNKKEYWDFSFILNIILTAVSIAIFVALSVVFGLLFDDIVVFIQSHTTAIPVLIAFGALLVEAIPLAIYIVLAIRKSGIKRTPKPTKEESLRQEIREKILREKEEEKLQARLDSGEITIEEFDNLRKEQVDAAQPAQAVKGRCFNLTGKILIFAFAIVVLVLHIFLSFLSQKAFYTTTDISKDTIERTIINNEYVVKSKGAEKFKFLVDKEMKYDDPLNFEVEREGKKANIYLGKLPQDDSKTENTNENTDALKIILPFYDKAHQVAKPDLEEKAVLAYGKYVNISENKYYYTILLDNDFVFIEADSAEVGYTIFKELK